MSPWVLLCLWISLLAAEPQPDLGRDSTFCHVLRSGSGNRYLSFLHRDPDGLRLYQSTWTPGGRLLDCAVREEAEMVRVYLDTCSEGNRGNANGTGSPEIQQNLRELERSRHRCSGGPGVRMKRALEEAEPGHRRRTKRGWTMPGTLWCGAGDSAGNFTDLGIFQGADLCCREHDHCAERLTAFEFNYGIRNYRLHTVSHCDCDYRFKKCLHDINDTISTFVGITFFNLLEMPCLVLEETEECMEWHWWGACKKYGPVPVAQIKRQGNYNYTHPFSDELDDKYRPNRTDSDPLEGSSTPISSLGAEPVEVLSSDSGAKKPRPHMKKGRKQKKNQTDVLQETAEEGKKDNAAGTEPGLSEAPRTPQNTVLSSHLDELLPLTEQPPPGKNQEPQNNGSLRQNLQDTAVAGLDHPAVREGENGFPQPPEMLPTFIKNTVLENVKSEPIGNTSDGHPPSASHRHPHKDKLNQHYISKSCGCYRRLDQCEYKIAPNEMKFQLHNLDQKTLYHCNCTKRLARFLRRKKGANEVEDILSDFVSPSCFMLEPLVTCKREEQAGTSCTTVPTALLSKARHLQRAMNQLQKDQPLRAPGKVKRQERAPLKLYDTCIQRVGASIGQQEL